MVRSILTGSSDSPTYVEPVESFKVYNRHGEDFFGTEEMETDPHIVIYPISLTANDDLTEVTTTSSTAPDNTMGIPEHGIEGPMVLSNSLFVEEKKRSQPNPTNLEVGEPMPYITYVQETFVTCSPEVEIPASNKSVHRDEFI